MNRKHEFIKNKSWSDKFNTEFKRILSEKLTLKDILDIENATTKEDMKEGTDLKYVIKGHGTIGARVRRPNCTFQDFTIRSKTPYKYKTEWDKIKSGYTDWYIYAWTNIDEIIEFYIIIDMGALRNSGLLDKNYPDKPNGDGTYFKAIELYQLKLHNCIKATNIDIILPKISKSDNIFGGKQITF